MKTDIREEPRVDWPALGVVVAVHLLALGAFVPWLFSWTGVALAVGGCYVFGTLGINLCFHRLLSHRSFKCPLWLEHAVAILGVCCLQRSPAQFVATHRAHHQHSDHDGDPHSPLKSLFWGHMGWALVKRPELYNTATYEQYAKDVLRDRFYMRLERNLLWIGVYMIHALLFFLAGFGVGLLLPGGSAITSLQLGMSVLFWGAFVRTVLVWHITWSVNSIGHVWGYQNYETRGNSRNSLIIGLISNGDGWHNNHHADQRAASHGHRWWELDVTHMTLLALQLCGLTWDLVPINAELSGDDKSSGQLSTTASEAIV